MTNTKKETKDKARYMYLRFHPSEDIKTACGISDATLSRWVNGDPGQNNGFKHLRQQEILNIIDDVRDRNRRALAHIGALSIDLVLNSLKHLSQRGSPLNLKEAKFVSEIWTNFDRIQRLDSGETTDNVKHTFEPITLSELKMALEKDVFLNLIPTKEVNSGHDGHNEESGDGSGEDIRQQHDGAEILYAHAAGLQRSANGDNNERANGDASPNESIHTNAGAGTQSDPGNNGQVWNDVQPTSVRGPIADPFGATPGNHPGIAHNETPSGGADSQAGHDSGGSEQNSN